MSKAPHVTSTWRRVRRPRYPDQWFLLHSDVKSLNVLLDYSSVRPDGLAAIYEADSMPADLTTTYPAVLLADFGLSTYTSETQDPTNTGQLRSGTKFWKPPEQELRRDLDENGAVTGRGLSGADFHPPVNTYGRPTSSANDIWPVAKIVFDMMYLNPKDHVSKFLGQTREALFREQGDHFLQEDFGDSVPEALRYSAALVRLVRRCLTPNAQRRPSPEVLLRDTAAGLHRCISTMRRARAHGQDLSVLYRVYYEGRDIEALGLGTLNQCEANTADYEDAQQGMPLDDPLRFPLPKWVNFQDLASGLPIRRDGDIFIFTENANPTPDQPGDSSLQVEPPESVGSHNAPRSRSGNSETRPHQEQKAATPTLNAYHTGMTIGNMIIELKFRKHELGLVQSLQKSRAIKMRFAELLVDADKAGKPGRGVWQGRKKATRR